MSLGDQARFFLSYDREKPKNQGYASQRIPLPFPLGPPPSPSDPNFGKRDVRRLLLLAIPALPGRATLTTRAAARALMAASSLPPAAAYPT
jgi:hypothetical protein